MGWKPLSSAPKDGTAIRVRRTTGGEPVWARYWTQEMLDADGWPDDTPGWFEYRPEVSDGDCGRLDYISEWDDPAG